MTRTCPVCGAAFAPNPARPRQVYCSRACKALANRRAADRRKSAKRAARRKQLVCPVCGKAFVQGRVGQLYCSRHCAKTAGNRAAARKRAEARGVRTCEWCGAAFSPKTSLARFCSRRCSRASAYNQRRGAAAAARKRAEARADLDALARVRAYLSLPPAERWARRGELTQAERALARKMYMENHPIRTVHTNNLCH